MMKPLRKFKIQTRVVHIEGLSEYWMTINNEYEVIENDLYVITLRIKHYPYDDESQRYVWRTHHFNYFKFWMDSSGNYRLETEE